MVNDLPTYTGSRAHMPLAYLPGFDSPSRFVHQSQGGMSYKNSTQGQKPFAKRAKIELRTFGLNLTLYPLVCRAVELFL